MKGFSKIVAACVTGLMALGVGAASAQVEIGEPGDDVWCYIRSSDPGGDPVIRLWSDSGIDVNPTGYPGRPGTEDFWSYGFASWSLDNLPPDYEWRGATITLTVAEGTNYNPATSDVYVRLLDDGFDEDTWTFGVGAGPVSGANRRVVADDSRANQGPGSTITIDIPRNVPSSVLRRWAQNRRIDVALTTTADFRNNSEFVRIASKENLLYDGPKLTLR